MKGFFKPFDFLFFALFAAAVAFSAAALKGGGEKKARLVIEAFGSEYVFPLDEERTLEIKGKIGISKIKVEGGEAFFVNSPCPNKICVGMPHVKNENDWAACIPNQVFIRVE